MDLMRPIYVCDTNVLIDYPDVIPNGTSSPEEPTIDLAHAHLVIPTAVIRELSSFKKEKSDRGKAARVVLKRIRALVEGHMQTMDDAYNLKSPIQVGDQLISVLPVHKDFKKPLPFAPASDDMDGQIILATLTVMRLHDGFLVNEGYDYESVANRLKMSVTLLTNDNGLAIRARERGILTSRYGYKHPEPYTGRRDVMVPPEIFYEFFNCREVTRDHWETCMPDNTPKLVANEFIVMELADTEEYPRDFDIGKFEHIGRYDIKKDAIVALKYVRDFPVPLHNAGQAMYAEALSDPDIPVVICTGPAGSGKTFMATVYGYNACKNGDFIGVTVVPCENHNNIGALPGDLDEKMDPEVQPIKNALRNYLLKNDKNLRKQMENFKKYGAGNNKQKGGGGENSPESVSIKEKLRDLVDLIWKNWFSNIPIENARGRDFAYEFVLLDEFQDQNITQAKTLLKRLGIGGKTVITGDLEQIHNPYQDKGSSGLTYAREETKGTYMVAQVCFTEEEVIRHPFVKYLTMREKDHNLTENNDE